MCCKSNIFLWFDAFFLLSKMFVYTRVHVRVHVCDILVCVMHFSFGEELTISSQFKCNVPYLIISKANLTKTKRKPQKRCKSNQNRTTEFNRTTTCAIMCALNRIALHLVKSKKIKSFEMRIKMRMRRANNNNSKKSNWIFKYCFKNQADRITPLYTYVCM